MSDLKSEKEMTTIRMKPETIETSDSTKISKKPKSYAKAYKKLSSKYSSLIEDSEQLFLNYTSLRKDYISLSNKIGSLTDILALIDRLHDHQHDISDEKSRIESIITAQPKLVEFLKPLIDEDQDIDPESHISKLKDLYPLTDLAIHLVQDRVEETNPHSETAWLRRDQPSEEVKGEIGGPRKRKGSATVMNESDDVIKKRKTNE